MAHLFQRSVQIFLNRFMPELLLPLFFSIKESGLKGGQIDDRLSILQNFKG
jgi:hypothetical protein